MMKRNVLQSAVLAMLLCGVAGHAGASIPDTTDNVIVKPTYSAGGGTREGTEVTNADAEKVFGDYNTVIGLSNQVGKKIDDTSSYSSDSNTVIGYMNSLMPYNFASGGSVIGYNNKVGSSESVVIGLQNKVAYDDNGTQTDGKGGYRYNITLGYKNSVDNAGSAIAIGQESAVSANYGIAVGYLARSNAKSSMALGFRAYTDVTADAIAYDSSTKTWTSTVSFGSTAAQNDNSNIYLSRLKNIAAGVSATDAVNVTQMNTAIDTAIGKINIPSCIVTYDDSSSATYWLDLSWNSSSTTRGKQSVAYGYLANAQTNYSIALGSGAKTVKSESGTVANAGQNIAIGYSAKTLSDYSIAMGASSQATGSSAIALGYKSQGTKNSAIAIGNTALANNWGAIAIGANTNQNVTAGYYAVAVGYNAKTAGESAVAIGNEAKASEKDSVAIGHNSVADEENTVSVGRARTNSLAAITRKIVHVAAGVADTDAVNLSQIKTEASTTQNNTYIKSTLNGSALSTDGTVGLNIAALDAKAVAAYEKDTAASGKINEIDLSGAARSDASGSKKGLTNQLIANDGTVLATFTAGSIADGNYGFISGDTVYDYVTPVAKAGTALKTISASNSTGVNLGLLDAAIEEAKTSALYNGSDTITIDANDKTIHVTNMAMSTMWKDAKAATASGWYAFAIGGEAEASGHYSYAVGLKAKATGMGSVAIGGNAEATWTELSPDSSGDTGATVAIGMKTKASGNGAAAVGVMAEATGEDSVAFGSKAKGEGQDSTAVGTEANASVMGAIAVGGQSAAFGLSAVAVGSQSKASGVQSAAFGNNSQATNDLSLALGGQSIASGQGSSAVGYWSLAGNTHDTALGNQSVANASGATALGSLTHAYGVASTAIGYQSNVNAGVTAGVAIGYASVAKTGLAQENGDSVATVSFGHVKGDTYTVVNNKGEHVSATYGGNLYSRLTNIADGKNDHDAATYGQLVNAQKKSDGTYTEYEFGSDGVVTILNNAGGIAFKLKMAASGSVEDKDAGYVTGSTVYNYLKPTDAQGVAKDGNYVFASKTTGQNLYALDEQVKTNADNIATIQGDVSSVQTDVTTVSGKVTALDTRVGTLDASKTYNVIKAGDSVSQNLVALDGAITGSVMPDISHLKDITRSDGATAEGTNSLALGNDSHANATNSISFGTGSKVTGEGSVAIGKGSVVTGSNSIAVGVNHTVCGNNSGAFGDPNNVHGHDSYAFGNGNTIGVHEKDGEVGNNTFVLGNNVTTTASNAVILGNESTAEEDNIVSVGSEGGERKIIHVRAGENDTDAVNVSQLKQSVSEISADINKVGAGAAALAALHPEDYNPLDKWSFAVGYGHYKNANAGALGAFYKPNADTTLSVGGTIGNGDSMMNAGVSFKLGTRGKMLSANTSNAELVREVNQLRAQNIRNEEKNARYEEKIDAQDKKIKELEAQMQKLLQAVGKA